jgi:large repetitive protein
MRRTTLISALAALACFTALAVVASAPAGDFADAACSGDPTKVCPAGTVGQPYSVEFTLKEPGDACPTFKVSSGDFPPGLTLASDEGVARGTPTQAGSFTFYVTVSYTCGTGGKGPGVFSDQKYTINVNPGAPPKPSLVVTTVSLPDGGINQPYTSPGLAATGSAVNSWSLVGGALPAGLTLGSNGVITGTPTQSGTFAVTVQANGNGVTATKQLSLFVLAPLAVQTLVNKTPPERGLTAKKLVGAPLTTGVKAVGGRPPYTFTATGTLPPGLTLDSATGRISGAGSAAGRYPFTVTVTDGTGAKASVEWNVTILPLLDFTKGKGLPLGHVDRLYSARIPVRGKDSASAEFALAGQIPPGLGIDENGRLTGMLLKAGSYQLKVYAFSANGAPISKTFRVRVRG